MGIFTRPKPETPTRETAMPEPPVEGTEASEESPLDAYEDAPASKSSARVPAALIYGIDEAIELMRELPRDNIELVVRVVKATLQSADIDVDTVIEDAKRRQAQLEGQIEERKAEIVDLEAEVARHKKEISKLETQRRETVSVKERLSMAKDADGNGKAKRPPTPTPRPVISSTREERAGETESKQS